MHPVDKESYTPQASPPNHISLPSVPPSMQPLLTNEPADSGVATFNVLVLMNNISNSLR